MSTPDGIGDDDWEKVRELTAELANHAEDATGALWHHRLMMLLDELDRKHGDLPSLLATRAEFCDEPQQQEALLLRAYDLALQRRDGLNLLLIAHSLTDLYISDRRDAREGKRWLATLDDHVAAHGRDDHWLQEEAARLRGQLARLDTP